MAEFTFVDLFAGIGGFRQGLANTGGDCVYTVEWDRFACTTYRANFHSEEDHEPLFEGDIREVAALPPHDVLAAGFPCQPFSIAGVSKKLSLGRPHGFLDETQGTLFHEVARLAAVSETPVLLLENVKNLLSHDRGRTWRIIEETLRDLGYTVAKAVIDARAWVPQHRERVFIVGLHKDIYGERSFIFPAPPPGGPVLMRRSSILSLIPSIRGVPTSGSTCRITQRSIDRRGMASALASLVPAMWLGL